MILRIKPPDYKSEKIDLLLLSTISHFLLLFWSPKNIRFCWLMRGWILSSGDKAQISSDPPPIPIPIPLSPSSPAMTCPQLQTDFSLHNPMPLASRLNHRGQRLTATPLRHCDPARDWPADPPPTHYTQAGPSESEVINSLGDYFRLAVTINLCGHHINMLLPKETE